MAKKMTKSQMQKIKNAAKQVDASSAVSAKYNLQRVAAQYQRSSERGKTRTMIESEKQVRKAALKAAKVAAANEEIQMYGDFLENVSNTEKNQIIRWLHDKGYAMDHYTYREDLTLMYDEWQERLVYLRNQFTKKVERTQRSLKEADKWAEEFLDDWG